jgi:arylsulfatase A-like enzyme
VLGAPIARDAQRTKPTLTWVLSKPHTGPMRKNEQGSSTARPNVLVLMFDQVAPSALGAYGNGTVRTPTLDALARGGVVFDAAYSNSPLCTPARYCMMTGQLPSATRGYDNAAYLPSTIPTFAHHARAAGYRTVLDGKMHFVGPDQLHGFEERRTTDVYPADFGWTPNWLQPDERIDWWFHNMDSVTQAGVAEVTSQLLFDDEVGHQGLRALQDLARDPDDRPWLLVVSFTHPTTPTSLAVATGTSTSLTRFLCQTSEQRTCRWTRTRSGCAGSAPWTGYTSPTPTSVGRGAPTTATSLTSMSGPTAS